MSELAIIGIGSPFGDDRLGWQVIERLQAHPQLEQYSPGKLNTERLNTGQISLQQCDRPGVMLLEYLRDARQAILVDAVLNVGRTGEIVSLDEGQISNVSAPLSSHGIGVAEAIQLGRQLGGLPSEIMLLGITTDASEAGSFSEEIIQQLCVRIIHQVHHCFNQPTVPV